MVNNKIFQMLSVELFTTHLRGVGGSRRWMKEERKKSWDVPYIIISSIWNISMYRSFKEYMKYVELNISSEQDTLQNTNIFYIQIHTLAHFLIISVSFLLTVHNKLTKTQISICIYTIQKMWR